VLAFVNSSVSPEGVTPPLKELFDYARVHMLAPGASQVITFGLSYRVLSHVDVDGPSWVLPGRYQVKLQNDEVIVQEFELVGEAALIEEMPQPKSQPPHTATTPATQPSQGHRHVRAGSL